MRDLDVMVWYKEREREGGGGIVASLYLHSEQSQVEIPFHLKTFQHKWKL